MVKDLQNRKEILYEKIKTCYLLYNIPQYAAKKGMAATKAMLSRAAIAATKRVGLYAGIIPGILTGLFNVLNIYGNLGHTIAQYIDARDYHPNNGRINAWA